jgi:hypothetical protein
MNTHTHIPDKEGQVLLVSWVWQHFHLHHEVKCQEVPQNVPLVLDLGSGKTSPPNPKTHTHTHTHTNPFLIHPHIPDYNYCKKNTLWSSKKLWRTTLFFHYEQQRILLQKSIFSSNRKTRWTSSYNYEQQQQNVFQILLNPNPNPKWPAQATEKLLQRKFTTKNCEFEKKEIWKEIL